MPIADVITVPWSKVSDVLKRKDEVRKIGELIYFKVLFYIQKLDGSTGALSQLRVESDVLCGLNTGNGFSYKGRRSSEK